MNCPPGPGPDGPSSAPSDGSGPRGSHGEAGRTPEDGNVHLIGLLNILLERRHRLVASAALVAGLIVGITLLLPRTWTSSAAFLPQGDQLQSSRLSSLAAQFGVGVPLQGGGESPQFYADLMRSEALLKEVVATEYGLPGPNGESARDTVGRDLISVYGVEDEDPDKELVDAVDELREDLWVTTDAETGVVRFSVEMESPGLARQVADRLIALVNEFNLQTRQSQAAEEAEFLEERVEEARSDLHAAEDSLEAFLETNRGYESSPTLRFEYQRLQRRVGLQQQVYTSLAQSYEEARISRVRNTPVITVVEPPERPANPDRRRLLMKGLLGLVLGFFLAALWTFWDEYLRGARDRLPDEHRRFVELWSDVRSEIGGLRRRLRATFSREAGS